MKSPGTSCYGPGSPDVTSPGRAATRGLAASPIPEPGGLPDDSGDFTGPDLWWLRYPEAPASGLPNFCRFVRFGARYSFEAGF